MREDEGREVLLLLILWMVMVMAVFLLSDGFRNDNVSNTIRCPQERVESRKINNHQCGCTWWWWGGWWWRERSHGDHRKTNSNGKSNGRRRVEG